MKKQISKEQKQLNEGQTEIALEQERIKAAYHFKEKKENNMEQTKKVNNTSKIIKDLPVKPIGSKIFMKPYIEKNSKIIVGSETDNILPYFKVIGVGPLVSDTINLGDIIFCYHQGIMTVQLPELDYKYLEITEGMISGIMDESILKSKLKK